MSEELKPCPFCGSSNIAAAYHSSFVICEDCNAFGPGNADLTHDEAVELWNTRTPEQAIAATLGKQGYYTDRDDEGTHIMCDRCGEYIGTAEEIAATLGGWECENANDVMKSAEIGFLCSECGSWDDDPQPRFCHNCGRKVKR